jgi:hypothetical protein
MQDRRSLLRQALREKLIVRFSNPYESGWTHGYVLDIGPEFFLLALIGEDMAFNGFQCPRLADVRHLRVPDPCADFAVSALLKRGQRLKGKPKIDLSDLSVLLKSANGIFPLVTIHRGRVKPDVCWVGRVLEINKSKLTLLEIGPDAVWRKRPSKYSLAEITCVEFGGGYEEALHLVGGKPPRLGKATSGSPKPDAN